MQDGEKTEEAKNKTPRNTQEKRRNTRDTRRKSARRDTLNNKGENMKEHLRDELVVFYSKFAVMISNGIPLTTSLSHLAKESRHEDVKHAIKKIHEETTLGKILADGMKKFPSVFDESTIQLIQAGEETGNLDLILKIIPEKILFSKLEEWNT